MKRKRNISAQEMRAKLPRIVQRSSNPITDLTSGIMQSAVDRNKNAWILRGVQSREKINGIVTR